MSSGKSEVFQKANACQTEIVFDHKFLSKFTRLPGIIACFSLLRLCPETTSSINKKWSLFPASQDVLEKRRSHLDIENKHKGHCRKPWQPHLNSDYDDED